MRYVMYRFACEPPAEKPTRMINEIVATYRELYGKKPDVQEAWWFMYKQLADPKSLRMFSTEQPATWLGMYTIPDDGTTPGALVRKEEIKR